MCVKGSVSKLALVKQKEDGSEAPDQKACVLKRGRNLPRRTRAPAYVQFSEAGQTERLLIELLTSLNEPWNVAEGSVRSPTSAGSSFVVFLYRTWTMKGLPTLPIHGWKKPCWQAQPSDFFSCPKLNCPDASHEVVVEIGVSEGDQTGGLLRPAGKGVFHFG